MSSLSENWLAGFRVVDDGRTSVATYYWDAGSLSWVAGVQPGAGGGGLTNAELRASPVPVSLTSTTITGSVAVTGTFFQATQPISAASLPLPTGAATEATLATRLTESTYTTRHPVVGQALMAASMPVVIASNQSAVPVTLTSTTITGSVAVTGTVTANQGTANTAANGWFQRLTDGTNNVAVKAASTAAVAADVALVVAVSPNNVVPVTNATNDLAVTVTAAAAAIATLTLPAVASQFHRIQYLEITAYTTVARVGGVAPVLVTSTNLPGSPVWTLASAAAVGTTERIVVPIGPGGLRSSVLNTATTIVGPATASIIWRITAIYRTSA